MNNRLPESQNSQLKNLDNCATLKQADEMVVLSRRDLEDEHGDLLRRIHHLRRILGYPPLMTGKQQREVST